MGTELQLGMEMDFRIETETSLVLTAVIMAIQADADSPQALTSLIQQLMA